MRRVLRCGDRALLVELADTASAMELTTALRRMSRPGIEEIVPGERTVLVRFEPRAVPAGEVEAMLLTAAGPAERCPAPTCVTLAIVYDGDDLAHVASFAGLSIEEVVARHANAEYHVGFVGFAPGFAYLIGGDPLLRVPRRREPRSAVPAGSVALAEKFCGVYPRRSPGGWQLIGRTDAVLWDTQQQPPSPLLPGTSVRFVRRRSFDPSDR